MTAATEWWWIRHAPVPGMVGRLYGATDLDCDCSAEDDFRALAAALPEGAVFVVTSLRRTHQTLAAIAAAADGAGAPAPPTIHRPRIERAFAEQHFGLWQGLTWDEMHARDPHAYARFWRDPTRSAPPGGESFAGLMGRVRVGIERITAEHRGHTIVVVAHAGSIRAAVATALGLGPDAAMAVTIDTLSVTRIGHLAGGLPSRFGHKPGRRAHPAWVIRAVNASPRWISQNRL